MSRRPNESLQYFTQPAILKQIGFARLTKFFDAFRDDCPSLPSDFDSLAAFLASSEIPDRLQGALFTLEAAASPHNRDFLDSAIQQRIPCVGLAGCCPLDCALELWFHAPDELSQFAPARDAAPAEPPSPPLEERDGERRPSHVCPSTPDICCPPSDSTIQPSNDSTPSRSSIQNPVSSIASSSIPHSAFPTPHSTSTLNSQPSTNSNSADFTRLASLWPADYDRVRKAETKRLGIRVETLDAEVDRHRLLMDDEKAREVILKAVVPWPEPVNGAEVLDQVASRFTLHVVMHPCAADAIALWEAHAHIFTAFRLSPRLNLTSAEPECGKTTTVDLIAAMAPRPLRTENLTAPVLFRVVAQQEPVLLLDEVDTFLPNDKELRGLLNAGHKRGGCAFRCEGTNNTIRGFKAFAPAVLAGIGALSGTLHGRSIRIHLVKAKEGEVTAHFNELKAETETELCRKVARWTQDNFAAIAACDPVMPKAAFNRLGDNWRPLFAIAHVAGGPWPARVLAAFHHLAPRKDEFHESLTRANFRSSPIPHSALPIQHSAGPSVPNSELLTSNSVLFAAIRSIFTQRNATRLFSKDLISALQSLTRSDAPTLPRSNVLSVRSLALRLAQFGIHPRNILIAGRQAKGYLLSDFTAPFLQFLAAPKMDESGLVTPKSDEGGSSFSI